MFLSLKCSTLFCGVPTCHQCKTQLSPRRLTAQNLPHEDPLLHPYPGLMLSFLHADLWLAQAGGPESWDAVSFAHIPQGTLIGTSYALVGTSCARWTPGVQATGVNSQNVN